MADNTTGNFQPEDMEKLRKVFAEILRSPCWNELTGNNKTDAEAKARRYSEDSMAVVYIILVLMLFGCSLLILLLKYLRKERESSKMQRFYDDYLDKRPSRSMVVHYDDEGRCLKTKTSQRSLRRYDLNFDLSSPTPSSTGDTPLTSPSMTPLVTPEPLSTSSSHSILKRSLLENVV